MKNIMSIFAGKPKKTPIRPSIPDQVLLSLEDCLVFVDKHLGRDLLYHSNNISKETEELIRELKGGHSFNVGVLDAVSELSYITDAVVRVLSEYSPVFTYKLSSDLLQSDANIPQIVSEIPIHLKKFLNTFFTHVGNVLQSSSASFHDIVNFYGPVMIEPLDQSQKSATDRDGIFSVLLRENRHLFEKEKGNDRGTLKSMQQVAIGDRTIKVSFPKGGVVLPEAEIQKRLSVFGKINNV